MSPLPCPHLSYHLSWPFCCPSLATRFALVWEREQLQGLGGALLRVVRNQVLLQSGQEVRRKEGELPYKCGAWKSRGKGGRRMPWI